MVANIDKNLLHEVIDELPPDVMAVVYKMFSSFIDDHLDRNLSPEERKMHMAALQEDVWVE